MLTEDNKLDMADQRMLYLGNIKEIPIGAGKKFVYPARDERGSMIPGWLIHLDDGLVAYDGLCTHLHAELEWNRYIGRILCTLHDGVYDPKTGRPILGLPREPLKKLDLKLDDNGDIYLIL